jgi:hypothetical protein
MGHMHDTGILSALGASQCNLTFWATLPPCRSGAPDMERAPGGAEGTSALHSRIIGRLLKIFRRQKTKNTALSPHLSSEQMPALAEYPPRPKQAGRLSEPAAMVHFHSTPRYAKFAAFG